MSNKLGPYELNSIVTGDARELAKAIPDESVDLIFADPPYWVGFQYGSGKSDNDFDYIDPVLLVTELKRISSCVLITSGMRSIYDYPRTNWLYGWFKPGSTRQNGIGGFNTWEPILVYGKPKKRVYQDSSYLPTVSNLNGKDANFHGCPKPLKLLLELIERFTNEQDIVCDPFVGSGTTALACKILNRQYLAFEIDPETADLARQRVANTQPPLPLVYPEQMSLIAEAKE